MNIPNVLTFIRLLLVPLFAYCMYREQYFIAGIIFLTAGATDILDGYIARKLHQVTSWGKIADPLSDKLMQATALVLLTFNHLIPLFVVVIVIAKEVFMGLGAFVVYRKSNIVVSSSIYGKVATVAFYIAIIFILIFKMLDYNNMSTHIIVSLLLSIAVSSTLTAVIMYFIKYKSYAKIYSA